MQLVILIELELLLDLSEELIGVALRQHEFLPHIAHDGHLIFSIEF